MIKGTGEGQLGYEGEVTQQPVKEMKPRATDSPDVKLFWKMQRLRHVVCNGPDECLHNGERSPSMKLSFFRSERVTECRQGLMPGKSAMRMTRKSTMGR